MNPNKSGDPVPKPAVSHLHAMNLVVALLAGIISITGGIYTLKNNVFSGPAYGSLQGVVRDERIAKPLKLAVVEISDLAGAVVNTAKTDDDGRYLVESLKAGNYVVKFAAPLHKIETKTIKIEKDLASSINVDLVPEAQSASAALMESAVSASRNIPAPYTPSTTYQTTPSAVPGYAATGASSYPSTVPSPVYSEQNSSSNTPEDPAYQDSQFSGSRRHPRRPPPGGYEDTSSTGSQGGSALAQVGTQLLQAWMSKKSEDSSSTSSASS